MIDTLVLVPVALAGAVLSGALAVALAVVVLAGAVFGIFLVVTVLFFLYPLFYQPIGGKAIG
jgi:hypothetical protein